MNIFSQYCMWGSMIGMSRLHVAWPCASSPDQSWAKSCVMPSIHIRFGLPFLLFPGTSTNITVLPHNPSSLLITCPCHFINLRSCTFLDISPTFVVPHKAFVPYILTNCVTPHIRLNIPVSATCNFPACAFLTAHVSVPSACLPVCLTVCLSDSRSLSFWQSLANEYDDSIHQKQQ